MDSKVVKESWKGIEDVKLWYSMTFYESGSPKYVTAVRVSKLWDSIFGVAQNCDSKHGVSNKLLTWTPKQRCRGAPCGQNMGYLWEAKAIGGKLIDNINWNWQLVRNRGGAVDTSQSWSYPCWPVSMLLHSAMMMNTEWHLRIITGL